MARVALLALLLAACGTTPSAVSTASFTAQTTVPPTSTAVVAAPSASITPTVRATPIPTSPATSNPLAGVRIRGMSGPGAQAPAQVIATSARFQYLSTGGQMSVPLPQLQSKAEEIWAYVADRLGATVSSPIQLGFAEPAGSRCAVRGLTVYITPTITIFANTGTDPRQVWGVLAHEVGHAVHFQGFPDGPKGDTVITEGLATWAAGKYWEEWQGGSPDANVRAFRQAGTLMPLYEAVAALQDAGVSVTSPQGVCMRDIAYNEWGSFVGYLIGQGGMAKLRALWESAPPPTGNPADLAKPTLDYQGIYGLKLDQLEQAWLAALLP